MSPSNEIAGRYRIQERLGAGGMSTVFLAMDAVLERPVALKLLAEHLAEDDDFVARFRREALAAARLTHPNIVQVFDSGQDRESRRHYIVMEYVDGKSCADVLRAQKKLGLEQAIEIVRDACHGLEYAHRAGVIHRDVKPGNLLLARESGTTKLADFGIAKAAEQTRITQVGSVLGTAAYLSPEQARGEEAGPASDVYSLGVCAYQFLTGRLPHEYTSLTELALKQQQEDVEPITLFRPEVPPHLDRAIRFCLERNTAQRFSSTMQLAEAIDAGIEGRDTETTRHLTSVGDQLDAETAMRIGEVTDATRALRSRHGSPTPAGRPQTAQRSSGSPPTSVWRRIAIVLVPLLVFAAVVGGTFYLLGGGQSDSGIDSVSRDDVQQQVRGIEQFLRDHQR